METRDLVRLRDIGGATGEQVFTISPDGRRAAMQVHRADPDTNSYCVATIVIELRPGARPIVVDQGHDLIRYTATIRGRMDYPHGIARTITPRWSPDGRSIAYLKKGGGNIQAWLAATDGSGARRLTELPEGVDDLRFTTDGRALVLSTRPDAPARYAAVEAEGVTGFHYDGRFAPLIQLKPFPPGPAPTIYTALDLASGAMRPATSAEADLYPNDAFAAVNQGSVRAISRSGAVATLTPAPDQRGMLEHKERLTVVTADGRSFVCAAATCGSHIDDHWWSADARRIVFLRRQGTAGETSAFYTWAPGDREPRLIHTTSDLLTGCSPVGRLVACMRETSLRPAHLVLLDLVTGKSRVVLDPNPGFSSLQLGRVERLPIRDAFGASLFADLVYPVGYRAGIRYPLVVVQYQSIGFLRGGTGDEYPIQALAGRGFMVLSMNRPSVLAHAPDAQTFLDVDKIYLEGFRHRRGVHSGIELAIAQVVQRGLADPTRVGLTGLSEGSSAVQWALVHDDRFAAMATTACCWGPESPWLIGAVGAQEFRYKGYPSWASKEGQAFWREMSPIPHAARIRTPLLIQTSDDELLTALDSYSELKAVGAPIELLAFPGEHHVKWQPVHRLAVYDRNVEWLSFWLQGGGSHPDRPRWQALKARLDAAGSRPTPDWNVPVSRPDQ